MYKSVIKFLFNNYCGLRYYVIFNKVYHTVRSSTILVTYFIIYGVVSFLVEGQSNPFSLVDLIFLLLLIPQLIMLFSSLLVREYMRVFSLTMEDIKKLDESRKITAFNKLKK